MSGNARVLLLDEPFKFIRGRARQRLGDMLSRLSRRLGIQVIMVSDVSDTGIIPDREFRVSLDRSRHSVVTMTESEATEA
jgi:ABC-type sulfate/molybdate transport systems ATPase subunit